VDVAGVAAVIIAVIAAWALFVVILWLARPRDVRMIEVVRLVPDLLRLVRDLLADRSVPGRVRLALLGLLAYLINPIDLIPEFIPVLGPVDDVVVAILVLRYVRHRLGDEELRRRWPGSADGYLLLSGVLG
jgi:uncharacterized membrane protein YkvA (DUF1232 family)